MMSFVFDAKHFFKNQSRSRRLQMQWLTKNFNKKHANPCVFDVGGVRDATYYSLLGIDPKSVWIWNFDQSTQANALVDFEEVQKFPAFPRVEGRDVTDVFLFNVLEHLYRPTQLLDWLLCHMPVGATLWIIVPFAYPIHPSPHDYLRMTPEFFKKYFSEHHCAGDFQVDALAEDFRDGFDFLLAGLFKSGFCRRLLANVVELGLWAISQIVSVFGAKKKMQTFVKKNPPAIAIRWTKRA